MILLGTTNPDQSGPGSDCKEGALHILQNFSAGSTPSDSFVSSSGYKLEMRSYPFAEMLSVCSTAAADWAESSGIYIKDYIFIKA